MHTCTPINHFLRLCFLMPAWPHTHSHSRIHAAQGSAGPPPRHCQPSAVAPHHLRGLHLDSQQPNAVKFVRPRRPGDMACALCRRVGCFVIRFVSWLLGKLMRGRDVILLEDVAVMPRRWLRQLLRPLLRCSNVNSPHRLTCSHVSQSFKLQRSSRVPRPGTLQP